MSGILSFEFRLLFNRLGSHLNRISSFHFNEHRATRRLFQELLSAWCPYCGKVFLNSLLIWTQKAGFQTPPNLHLFFHICMIWPWLFPTIASAEPDYFLGPDFFFFPETLSNEMPSSLHMASQTRSVFKISALKDNTHSE